MTGQQRPDRVDNDRRADAAQTVKAVRSLGKPAPEVFGPCGHTLREALRDQCYAPSEGQFLWRGRLISGECLHHLVARGLVLGIDLTGLQLVDQFGARCVILDDVDQEIDI